MSLSRTSHRIEKDMSLIERLNDLFVTQTILIKDNLRIKNETNYILILLNKLKCHIDKYEITRHCFIVNCSLSPAEVAVTTY